MRWTRRWRCTTANSGHPGRAAATPCSALNVVTAASDDEAARLFTTQQQAFVNLRRGRPGLVPLPLASAEAIDDDRTPARNT